MSPPREPTLQSYSCCIYMQCRGIWRNGVKPAGGELPSGFTQQTLWPGDRGGSIIRAMKEIKSFAATVAALLLGWHGAQGQSFSEYKFIFSGMAYSPNALGKLVGAPITDQTLLQDRARLGGIT